MRCSIAARLAREIGGFLCTRPGKVAWAGGVVSFSFDDFPKSAWMNGGAILDKYDVQGTYYTALHMAGSANHLGPMFDLDDIRAAHDAGHEIACHTFTHLDCCRASTPAILSEITQNATALAALLDGVTMTNFAYPYGAVSLAAKSALSSRFTSCRGTGQGINRKTVDLADLLGYRIYNNGFDRDRLCQVIDENRAAGGWLIFYTHDVADPPSPFGCTPAQLESIVAYAAENAPILPVRDVLASLGFSSRRAGSEMQAA